MRNPSNRLVAVRFLAMLVLLVSALPTLAAGDQSSNPATVSLPAWEHLTSAQREQLITPIRERWNAEPEKRQRMLDHAQRWHEMTPEQRKRAHHGMQRWQHMNPEQRTQMRALYDRMKSLPPEQRRALKADWRQMTAEQRRAWVQANPPSTLSSTPQE